MKENEHDDKETPNINEPSQAYPLPVSKKIIIGSPENQKVEMYKYWISLTPIERLNHVYNLHTNIYGEEVVNSSKKIGNRITFDNP